LSIIGVTRFRESLASERFGDAGFASRCIEARHRLAPVNVRGRWQYA